MRGKANVPVTCPTLIGITPAYAGKSQRLRRLPAGNGGSPPPMRGKAVNPGGAIM